MSYECIKLGLVKHDVSKILNPANKNRLEAFYCRLLRVCKGLPEAVLSNAALLELKYVQRSQDRIVYQFYRRDYAKALAAMTKDIKVDAKQNMFYIVLEANNAKGQTYTLPIEREHLLCTLVIEQPNHDEIAEKLIREIKTKTGKQVVLR